MDNAFDLEAMRHWALTLSTHLRNAWGVPFHVHMHHSDSWLPLSDDAEEADPNLLEAAQAMVAPLVTTENEETTIAIRLHAPSARPAAAVAVVPKRSDELVTVLARLSQMLVEQHCDLTEKKRQLAEYASQVTSGFAETSWLRSLAGSIRLTGERDSVIAAARTSLPDLRQLIGADSLAFLAMREQDQLRFWSCGQSLIEADVRKIIELFSAQVTDEPLAFDIRNAETNAVSCCLLAPVQNELCEAGWLLAINNPGSKADPEVHRPFEPESFGLLQSASSILAAHAGNAQLLSDRSELLTGALRTLINAIDAKDAYTAGHSDRVAAMAERLGAEMDLTEEACRELYMTGLLHDIGKIGVPDNVLQKPDKLTDDEFDIVQQHTVTGFHILKHLNHLSYVLPGVLHHHEAWDGTGYPMQLAGDAIPLTARILAVADAYDAMTSHRPYRKGIPTEHAEAILQSGAGKQWDAEIVEAFFAALEDIRAIAESASEVRHVEVGAD